ncbi:hypothetical protein [Chryseobacterium salviniae]|uniref:Lipoprotein n=1 Tax=Chryseobacterium salviniae TaxID=3101750 RepID=A0ABU6HTF2_9FLAO|nr:hypothetical protein [Chryseobacterium sp. T9W2-O]MEC3875999.1 hypothetical protein [Chryseobacterium sp. T9W2-O]
MKKILYSVIILIAISCKKNPEKFINDNADSADKIADTAHETSVTDISLNKEESLKKLNEGIIQALKDRNYKKFAAYIHPQKGICFSMYAFVDPEQDKKFSKADFEKYLPAKTIFTWGTLDGSGDLYKATINDYLKKWVYSKDFAAGQVSFNEFQGSGNSLNNLKKIYPNADFTENFLKGSEEYAGMDWKCLRLVFEKFQGKYYLVAVINDQWTI